MGLPSAPVILLMYRRPELTAQVFARIRTAQPRILIIVADGPKEDSVEDQRAVALTRAVVSDIDWDCDVHRIYSPGNLGLKERVSSGLTEAFQIVDEAIVLEDDCLPDITFFDFASELLERYRNDSRVGLIAGSSRVRGKMPSPYSYDFSPDLRIWGWASWKRTWQGFIDSGDLHAQWEGSRFSGVLDQLHGRRRNRVASMLKAANSLDSWALPFLAHFTRQRYLSAVPEVNLVENVGFGESSTHTKFENFVQQVPTEALSQPLRHPPEVVSNSDIDRVEGREDTLYAWRYVLRHPVEVGRRLFRFLRAR